MAKKPPRHERERRELKRYLRREIRGYTALKDATNDPIGLAEYGRAAAELGFVLIFMREQERDRESR